MIQVVKHVWARLDSGSGQGAAMDDRLDQARESPTYLSYLLRLWRMRGQAGTGWRASLESPLWGERLGFGSLEELFTFLREQTDEQDPECHSKK